MLPPCNYQVVAAMQRSLVLGLQEAAWRSLTVVVVVGKEIVGGRFRIQMPVAVEVVEVAGVVEVAVVVEIAIVVEVAVVAELLEVADSVTACLASKEGMEFAVVAHVDKEFD